MAIHSVSIELDCRKCSEEQRRDKGCQEDSPIPERWEVEGYTFQRCPLKLITADTNEYLKAYRLLKLMGLPNPGTWREQPYKFIEAMLIIDDQIKKIEVENGRK